MRLVGGGSLGFLIFARRAPHFAARKEHTIMLRIYPVILEWLASLMPTLRLIGKADPDLEKQMRRAMQSTALNTAEGMYSRGKNKKVRYNAALGSAREVVAAIELGVVFEYLPKDAHRRVEQADRIIGTLVNLSR